MSTLNVSNAIVKMSTEITQKSESSFPSFVQYCDEYVSVDNVRISPPKIVFRNAYEGKEFTDKLAIQNCGNRMATVRIGNPSSGMFQMKPLIAGKYLCPGMSIIRNVRYKYTTSISVTEGFVTVWINDKEIDYRFEVTVTSGNLFVEPQELNFGRIDAVNHAATKIFFIKNTGFKGTHFSIDLGRNPLHLTVEPLKGIAPAKSCIPVRVEVVGTHEGDFVEEIWIKTSPPQRVVITGTFIQPKLLVRKFINNLDFTLIDFPPTYYGSVCTRLLLIKNISSCHSMFCIIAEIKGTTMALDDAKKIDDNYKNFVIQPIDGRIVAQKGAVIQLKFKPVDTSKNNKKDKNYAVCFLKIVRMDCRDVTAEDEILGNYFDEKNGQILIKCIFQVNEDLIRSRAQSVFQTDTLTENRLSTIDNIASSLEHLAMEETVNESEEILSFEHKTGICLHGDKERAAISLRPDQIHLIDLTLNQNYNRELLVTNLSSRLPVRVKYVKTASIMVHPEQFDLEPNGNLEILITIKAVKLASSIKKVTFHLLGLDYPEDKKTYRKVGSASLKITFTTNVVEKVPKMKQCTLCNDLQDKLDPGFPYRLTDDEIDKKNQNMDFYIKYIRSLQKKFVQNELQISDYVNSSKPLKCQNHIPDKITIKERRYSPYIPLAPRLLYNIKISPKSIKLRKVTAFTTINDHFEVENLNPFPIYIFAKASKPSIVFDNNSRFFINGNEKKQISFCFMSSQVGHYYTNINLLLNESILYEITTVAHVVPKTLQLETDRVVFTEDSGSYQFFRLINNLNAYISFDWEIPEGCFKIYPDNGGIKAESSMLCIVTCTPDPAQPKSSECVMTSDSGQRSLFTATYQKREALVVFDLYEVDVGVIPLNVLVRKKVIVKNLKKFQVTVIVINEEPIPGIKVEPTSDILEGLDSQVFIINILLQSVIEFSTNVTFNIDGKEDINVKIKGIVDYPNCIFKPHLLHFRKIEPFSFDTLAFKIKNVSRCDITVAFPIDEYPEFSITDSEDEYLPHLAEVSLQPEQCKILFLHFHPVHITTYSCYLSYVINDIIGPVHINSGRSISPTYYLQSYNEKYADIPDVQIQHITTILSVIRINCCAIDKTLEFSKLTHNFLYFGENHYNNSTKTNFEIVNVSDNVVDICIRIDDLNDPFSLVPKEGFTFEEYDVSYKITLEPNEKAVLEAEFFPIELGEFEVKLPIFLRHYYDNKIFNYLTLKGVYGKPKITPSIQRCNFEPIIISVANEVEFTLRMENHFENCEVICESDLVGLSSTFKKPKHFYKGDYFLNVCLSYKTARANCFSEKVIFQCSCSVFCSIVVTGVVEQCLLTTYAICHLIRMNTGNVKKKKIVVPSRFASKYNLGPEFIDTVVNINSTSFPLFPKDDDHSEYGKYMRGLQKTLENWISSQVFYMKGYYRIPEGFSDYCKVSGPAKKLFYGGFKKSEFKEELPLLQLIMNIAGRGMRNTLAPSYPSTTDELEWLTYTYTINSNVLLYLREFPVYLPHVSAKFLLNHEQYVLYQKIKHPKGPIIEYSEFYRLHKQCWIDLILQIIKTFFLFRIVKLRDARVSLSSKVSYSKLRFPLSATAISGISTDDRDNILDLELLGCYEKELITWMQNCYKEEKTNLWSSEPPDKEIKFLDRDLQDGLILGAVTAHYCPYIKPQICNMYTNTYNPEEVFHNTCVLIKSWKMLRLSYIVSPLSFQNSGMVEMLLLITYLYSILPDFIPKCEVTIQAPLTGMNNTTIELENLGQDPICYRTVFFGNENKLFSVVDKITVPPKSTKTVLINYHAKIVTTVTTTLLFSGETPGQKYGKSLAVTIIGVADVTNACMEIPITAELYKPCEVTFYLESPFKFEANYSLFISYQPASKENNNLFSWEDIKGLRIVKECLLEEEMSHFDQDGLCSAKELICCQQIGPKNIWLYFTNPEVGDWGVQLILTGKVTESCYENIDIYLPEDYSTRVCTCKNGPCLTRSCPMILNVMIPMMNTLLWNARKAMLLRHVTGNELTFWSKHIYSSCGTRILKMILNSETHPTNQIIDDEMEYDVVMDKSQAFVTLSKVFFDDIISEESFPLPIHPIKNLLKTKKCVMKLVSTDKRETRFFKLFFKYSVENCQSIEQTQNKESA